MTRQQLSTTNPYINQLSQSLRKMQPATVDWLVLTHNDAHLLRRLDDAFPDGLLAVIALPQSRWWMDDEILTQAIDWAVRELGVQGVMLVGHSQGGVPEEQIRLLGGKAGVPTVRAGEARPSSGSLLDVATRAQSQTMSAQNHFEEQVQRLSRTGAVADYLGQSKVELLGLFYRAESGVFCVYDRQRRNFRPLLSEGAAA